MRRRRRVVQKLPPEVALRLAVVRGVLMDELTLLEGADRLAMDLDDLAALVAGARQAVIRTLGEHVLEAR